MRKLVCPPFELLVSYGQITVFDETIAEHFNDWRDAHVRQGFSWRPGSVAFSTIESWPMSVEIALADRLVPRDDAKRAIRVPFEVSPSSSVAVAVVCDKRAVPIPAGVFSLNFEHAMQETGDKMWCVLTFVPDPNPKPEVLIADSMLSPPAVFAMDADPAWAPPSS